MSGDKARRGNDPYLHPLGSSAEGACECGGGAPAPRLTWKNVLVAILGLVLQPLPFPPGMQELAFLLLQQLVGGGSALAQDSDPSPEPSIPTP